MSSQPPEATVRQLKAGGYVVASRSTTGAWWLVWEQDCSCPAGRAGQRCWHLRAVADFCAEQDRRHRRPPAPPNISALVD